MPVYQNNSSANIKVFSALGVETTVVPGASLSTDRYYDIADFDKTDDEPYINPVLGYTPLTFTEAGDETIVLETPDIQKIRIHNTVGEIDVYFQSKTNLPAVVSGWTTTTTPLDIAINGNCDTIVISGTSASSCDVIQMRGRQLL